MHKSKTLHLTIFEHLRPFICVEEAGGIHKIVNRINDPVKIIVPCTICEIELPISPDKSM